LIKRVPRPLLTSILWILVILWGWVIFFASSIPSDELCGSKLLAWDKLNHFMAFAVGGWLATCALRSGQPDSPKYLQLAVAVLLIATYGALDELHQLYTPGRSGADVYDWIADFLGGGAGALLATFTHGHLDRFVTRA
jgi:VanZ family protein